MTDKLIICEHCGGNACYQKQVSPTISNYVCYGCGYQTNTLMVKGEQFYEEQIETLPELYKDLMVEGKEGKQWMPSFITIEGKGTVFAMGKTTEEWAWAAMLHVPVAEDEKENFKNPAVACKTSKRKIVGY